MKKNIAPLIFGFLFIIAGLGYVGVAFFDWNFDIFFDGWWTLFIIIPAVVSIITNGIRAFTVGALAIGVLLLLSAQDIISGRSLGIFIVSTIIILIGVSLLINYFRHPKTSQFQYTVHSGGNNQVNGEEATNTYTYTGSGEQPKSATWGQDQNPYPTYNAILCGVDAKNNSSDFMGARASAILGGLNIDLRDVTINNDITVNLTAVMGGIDIFAPRNVRIVVDKTSILGGTDCVAASMPPDANVPVVRFQCTAIMGGIDIK